MNLISRLLLACLFHSCLSAGVDIAAAQDAKPPAEPVAAQEDDDPAGKLENERLFADPMDFTKAPEIPEHKAPSEDEIRESIEKGVQFLLKIQNPNGSWGSHVTGRVTEIYAPIPGSHHAFRGATTSLCISALLEAAPDDSQVVLAVDRAKEWMINNLDRMKRSKGDTIYNVWGHAYGIQALVRLGSLPRMSAETKAKIDDLIRLQIEMLERYESVDGGWGYYDFRYQARKPTSSSISFVNATVLIALREAKDYGIEVPQKIVDRAIKAIERQQKKDFSYLYGEYLNQRPMYEINRPAGSLGRSQACNAALRMWGDEEITDLVLENWLVRLYKRNGWLSIGRKRPIPHESWFAVAGYFYYYGHYYAGYCIDLLPDDKQAPYRAMLAEIMLRHQEPNGCWWDFPMYDYHRQYGTAFAIMTLTRTLEASGNSLDSSSDRSK